MTRIVVMRFNDEEELKQFLQNHSHVSMIDKTVQEFLIVESATKEYKKMVVARLASSNDKIIISTLQRYKSLTDNAKKIIDDVRYSDEEEQVKLQIGKSYKGIKIDKRLYYEVYNFAMDNGLRYARYDVENGEEIVICLGVDSIMCLK